MGAKKCVFIAWFSIVKAENLQVQSMVCFFFRKNAKCPESSVNHGPASKEKPFFIAFASVYRNRVKVKVTVLCCFLSAPPSFTSDPKCLHSLVSWAHHHGEACHSCPDLKEVLEGQCWGSVQAIWSCVDGHSYIMDTQCTAAANPGYMVNLSSGALGSGSSDRVMSEEEDQEEEDEEEQPSGNGSVSTVAQHSTPAVPAQSRRSALTHWTSNTEGETEINR